MEVSIAWAPPSRDGPPVGPGDMKTIGRNFFETVEPAQVLILEMLRIASNGLKSVATIFNCFNGTGLVIITDSPSVEDPVKRSFFVNHHRRSHQPYSLHSRRRYL
jgi:hypothetical protein